MVLVHICAKKQCMHVITYFQLAAAKEFSFSEKNTDTTVKTKQKGEIFQHSKDMGKQKFATTK